MSKISLKHSGGNVVSLNSPTSAPTSADVAFKLPNADGSNGQYMKTDGSGNLAFATLPAAGATGWTHVNDTSIGTGGSYTFSGIPTDTTAFRIMFSDISSNSGSSGSESYTGFRLGTSSGLKTANYNAIVGYLESSFQYMNAWTSRFMIISQNYGRSQYAFNGQIQCWKSAGTNKWHYLSDTNRGNAATYFWGQGEINLGASITQAQLFLNTGSFDGGSVSFSYYQD
tara:strand:+ start:537 stop:1217 length:681 start_codon:yes stop_codon:yes gene_type:complete